MSDECCTSGSNIMILSCSGGSNVGQLSNQAAVELTQEGFGRLYCLAGIGGRLSAFVESAKGVDQMIVIDGCDIACGKAVLESADVPLKSYLEITELGIEKNKNFKLKREDIDTVKDAVKVTFSKPQSPSALPRMSGSSGCRCQG